LKTQPINRSEDWPRERIIAQLLAKGSAGLPRDEARRIAANIAKLPGALGQSQMLLFLLQPLMLVCGIFRLASK
jgi:hypothetical protein